MSTTCVTLRNKTVIPWEGTLGRPGGCTYHAQIINLANTAEIDVHPDNTRTIYGRKSNKEWRKEVENGCGKHVKEDLDAPPWPYLGMSSTPMIDPRPLTLSRPASLRCHTYHGDVINSADTSYIDVNAYKSRPVCVVNSHGPDSAVITTLANDAVQYPLFDRAEVCLAPGER